MTDSMSKTDIFFLGFQVAMEGFQARIAILQCFIFHLGKLLLGIFSPTKGVPSCGTLYFGSVYEYGFVIHFAHLLQLGNKLVKEILQCILAPACAEPSNGGVIWSFLTVQQLYEVHPIAANFLNLAGRVNPALVGVGNYLEQYRWVDFRFPPFGRIGCIQFGVIQFLKLEPCQSDRCVLR